MGGSAGVMKRHEPTDPLPSRAGSEVASCSVKMISDSIYGTESSEEGRAWRVGEGGRFVGKLKCLMQKRVVGATKILSSLDRYYS